MDSISQPEHGSAGIYETHEAKGSNVLTAEHGLNSRRDPGGICNP